MKKIALVLIDLYRFTLAPYIPTSCRYYPTCSEYMKEAIIRKGLARGLMCGLKRILRCTPFHPGGYDPVP